MNLDLIQLRTQLENTWILADRPTSYVFKLNSPIIGISHTIVISVNEPSDSGLPIGMNWLCMNSNSKFYRKFVKLASTLGPLMGNVTDVIDDQGWAKSWVEVLTLNDIWTTPVIYTIDQTGVKGPKGDPGDKGAQGDKGDKGQAGDGYVNYGPIITNAVTMYNSLQ